MLMVIGIVGIGRVIVFIKGEIISLAMGKDIRECSFKDQNMEKEIIFIITEISTRVNGKMISKMDMVSILLFHLVKNIKVIGYFFL